MAARCPRVQTYLEKFPERSTAPPTVSNTGKLRSSRIVLFAIWIPPPTSVKPGVVMFFKSLFPTYDKLPTRVSLLPTVFKLGAEIVANLFESKIREEFTFAKIGTERVVRFGRRRRLTRLGWGKGIPSYLHFSQS